MLGLSALQISLIVGGITLILAVFFPETYAKIKSRAQTKKNEISAEIHGLEAADIKQELADWLNQSDFIARWSKLKGEAKSVFGLVDMRAASIYIPELVDDVDRPEVDECFVKILTALVTSKKNQVVKPVVVL